VQSPNPFLLSFYLDRRATDQAQTCEWIKEWLAQKDQAGVAQLEEIISQKADWERDIYGVYDELRELIFEWRIEKQLRLDQLEERARRARARRRPKP
jgi:hypothetical protein